MSQHWLFEIFSVTTREQLWDFEHILLCLFEAKKGITFRDIIITYLFFYFIYLLLFLSLCCCHSLSNIFVCYSPFLVFFSFPFSGSGVGVGCAGQTLVWVYLSSLYLVCSYCYKLCLAYRSMDPLDLMHVFVFEFVFYTLCTLCMVVSQCLGSRFYLCLLGSLISC